MQEKFMKQALKEAQKAYDKLEIPVGAVIVKDGKIIGDKINKHDNDLDYKIDNKIYLKDIKNWVHGD